MKVYILGTVPPVLENYKNVIEYLGYEYTVGLENYENYDCLIIPGGIDVDPKFYHQLKDEKCGDVDADLDEKQIKAIKYFVEQKKPILGICRGHQIINVALGGNLIQHIESPITHTRSLTSDAFHKTINTGGFMKELFGEDCVINSSHHQAVYRLGEGLACTSRAEDGTIEATEHTSLPIMTVQFHPERLTLSFKSDKAIDGMIIFKHFFSKYF